MSDHFSQAQEKAHAGFLEKFRHRLLDLTSKEIFHKGWNAAIKHFTPRLFQARSTARIALDEHQKTGRLSEETLSALKAITNDVADFEKNTTACFDEMEGSIRAIRHIFAKEETEQARQVVRHCDAGLWRIEQGKYKNR